MAGEFPSDGQVYQAVDGFVDALSQAAHTKYSGPGTDPIDSIKSLWRYPDVTAAHRELSESCDPALEILPGGFHDDAEALSRALKILDEDEADSRGFYGGYRAAIQQLSDWQGQAADAFRSRLFSIGKFVNEQKRSMIDTAGCLIAVYQVSSLARTDIISVFHSGIDACRAMEKTDKTQDLQASLYVAAGLASGTLNYVATSDIVVRALTSSAQTIGTTTTLINAGITGSDPQDILDSVTQAQRGVVERMNAAYGEIARKADTIAKIQEKSPPYPIGALPPSADVHRPDFRYADFSSPWRSTEGYGGAVHRAATQPTPSGSDGPGTIRQALG